MLGTTLPPSRTLTPLERLPDELIRCQLFPFLSLLDKTRLAKVSRNLRSSVPPNYTSEEVEALHLGPGLSTLRQEAVISFTASPNPSLQVFAHRELSRLDQLRQRYYSPCGPWLELDVLLCIVSPFIITIGAFCFLFHTCGGRDMRGPVSSCDSTGALYISGFSLIFGGTLLCLLGVALHRRRVSLRDTLSLRGAWHAPRPISLLSVAIQPATATPLAHNAGIGGEAQAQRPQGATTPEREGSLSVFTNPLWHTSEFL